MWPYRCGGCEYSTYNRENMQEHVVRVNGTRGMLLMLYGAIIGLCIYLYLRGR